MPGLTPANCITCSASPTRSRVSSVEKLSPTMGATGRRTCGKSGGTGSERQEASSNSAASAAALFDILDFHALAGHALRQGGGHEPVEVAIKDVSGAGRRDAGPEVLHKLVGLKNVGADLMSPADVRF